MVRLLPVNNKELVRHLKKFGYDGPFSGGKHLFMVRGETVPAVPNPHGGDIGPALLARILRQAGIKKDEWENTK